MEIRLFQSQDTAQIAQLFHDTVRTINLKDYSLSQVQAWAPDDIYFRDWVKVCSSRYTYVAIMPRFSKYDCREYRDDAPEQVIVGFAELEINGHIDCFYVHKDYQGRGVGKGLYQLIASQAELQGCDRLYTEASITAKGFFLKQGFVIEQEQQVNVRGEVFKNYRMVKTSRAQGFAPPNLHLNPHPNLYPNLRSYHETKTTNS